MKTEQFNRPVLHKRCFCNSQPGHNEDGVAEMPMKRCKPAAGRFPTPRVCRGRIWETYIILTQMDCKPICDGGAGTISGSRYIEPDELFFWTACLVQECRGRSPLPQ